MSMSSQRRFVLVSRKTRLQELVERFNTWSQARFYLEHNAIEVQDYLDEHDCVQSRLQEAERLLKSKGRFQHLERSLLPSYRFASDDILVVVGQDGLVANTLKYLEGQPVIAVNPDPGRWDGRLLPFEMRDLEAILNQVLAGRVESRCVRFCEGRTNDGQRLLAVNDLFIGPKTHTSALYEISWNEHSEVQSSSGIIVSTGLGSTGWFQSILAGARGITGQTTGDLESGFDWDAPYLRFSVREPFPSRTTGAEITFGVVDEERPLRLESRMAENGVIFSDGMEQDYLPFNAGTVLTVALAKTAGRLVVG